MVQSNIPSNKNLAINLEWISYKLCYYFGTAGRSRTDKPIGHDILSVACIPFHHGGLVFIHIQPSMCRLQAMTIGAKNSQVLETVIVAVAVDMVKLKWHTSIGCPTVPSAKLASLLLHASRKKPFLQFKALIITITL